MSLGFKNSPAKFKKNMTQQVLVGYLSEFAFVYLDDIIVYSNSLGEHLQHLTCILELLEHHGSFLGLSNWVRDYVLTDRITPMTDLLSSTKPYSGMTAATFENS